MKDLKILGQWNYEEIIPKNGYTGRSLYIDVSGYTCDSRPVSESMKSRFTGGRGFGLKLLWDAVDSNTKWDDPENEIVISGGPLCGITQYPGMGKFYAVFLSPLSEQTYDSNSGGHFGPLLKFAGWDAVEIQNKSEQEIIVFIDGDNDRVQFLESPFIDLNSYNITESLHEHFSDCEDDKRSISVISTGKASENSFWGCLNTSFYDTRRSSFRLKQAGRGGGGTILRDKKIAAIVVKKKTSKDIQHGVSDFETLKKTGIKAHKEMFQLDHLQCKMRTTGTSHLVEIMDQYHLLPVNNYQFGQHKETEKITSSVYADIYTQNIPDGCWYGCTMGCSKSVDSFEIQTGPSKGKIVNVDGPEYETCAALGSNIGIFDPSWTIEANYYADYYGFDTISMGTTMAFICECFERGYLSPVNTEGLDLKFGNRKDLMELIHRMANGKSYFANQVNKGVKRMKEALIKEYGAPQDIIQDIAMEGQGVEVSEYVSKESIAQWGGYFLTLKGPQHDEAWLIIMDRVDKRIPTFEDKAEALHYFPLFRTWFSLVGACKLPWNDIEPADNSTKYPPYEAAKVPEHLQNYVDVFNAVTGRTVTSEDLILMSERIYNFQQLFQIRMGKGTREFHNIPYRAMGPVFPAEWNARKEYYDQELKENGIDPSQINVESKIEKLRKIRMKQWNDLVDTVYYRRGWDKRGIPTIGKLKELGMDLPELVELVNRVSKAEDQYD